MPNIKFSYLYRDGGNNKNFNFLVYSNPNKVNIEELEKLIRSNLIDGTWFYVNEWKLPDLHFKCWDDEIDHKWHEFESVEYTDEAVNAPLTIDQLIKEVKKTHWYEKIYKRQ
ncbi:MAG: hypothetical protein M3O71_14300 [Bacteroidota bacterium]|nr:hypothetical protein [Bacteroidota bacterium]